MVPLLLLINHIRSRPLPEVLPQTASGGMAVLRLDISESGHVDKVEVLNRESVLPQASMALTDALRNWKFHPFLKDGTPVKVSAEVPVHWDDEGRVETWVNAR